jgi:hypothetical protein
MVCDLLPAPNADAHGCSVLQMCKQNAYCSVRARDRELFTCVPFLLRNLEGLSVAQAVSRRLPTAGAPFDTKSGHAGFVVGKVALGLDFSEYFGFPCRSQWPRGLRHEPSSPSRTLRSWVRIPLEAWISVCVYFVLFCV